MEAVSEELLLLDVALPGLGRDGAEEPAGIGLDVLPRSR